MISRYNQELLQKQVSTTQGLVIVYVVTFVIVVYKIGRRVEREQTQRKTADVGVMDPMTRRIIQAMEDMGFKSDVAKHAVMAVKNQTSGQYDVMLNEAVTWALDQESNNRDDQTQPQACVPLESSDAVAGATGSSTSTNCQDVACLKAENQQLRELLRCKICLDRQMEVTFLPCGHLVCCFVCAANIHKCPFCRKEISGTTNTGIPH
ncbi:E3 ubiquitin-protein ligase MYLIP-like isoform X2 [Ruditapes philippinarum]|uniref:E3 ubiquitin-protein ligase MYLIP-like isoform X2 n=1 Tax=Ruditapes philippinarum TaxID=129788 RepID=UPI00295B02B4|nr:E3 ubiquitin-protein ligase MYLIP-like isoform X2 [Ruditapes philippinarum]